jgi:hypothetical protein
MKTFGLMLIITLSAANLPGQPREGKSKELSLSGSYQTYSSGSGSVSSGSLLVSSRLGFFVFEGLEIEPEVLVMIPSGPDLVYMVNGNVSYNFMSAGKAIPFLLIGYGIANTVPFFNVPMTKTDFSVDVLNVGAGVKIFLHENVALRLEYRYQKITGQGATTMYDFYSYTDKVETTINTVQFGFSVLL